MRNESTIVPGRQRDSQRLQATIENATRLFSSRSAIYTIRQKSCVRASVVRSIDARHSVGLKKWQSVGVEDFFDRRDR